MSSTAAAAAARRVSVRRVGLISPEEQERAAVILRDGFWGCRSPVLRFRAHNDRAALLDLMRSRVKGALANEALFLAYHPSDTDPDVSDPSPPLPINPGEGHDPDSTQNEDRQRLIGAVITSLPGEGFTQLQKSYGDRDKPADEGIRPGETEAEYKTRRWVEEDLVPWFNDFSARSLGPGVMENSLYISLFAISPEVQGQGLGRETMNQVIAWGDEKGWEMTLFDHEPELVRFYSSFGFKEVGKEDRPCNGQNVTWWAMRRPRPQSVGIGRD